MGRAWQVSGDARDALEAPSPGSERGCLVSPQREEIGLDGLKPGVFGVQQAADVPALDFADGEALLERQVNGQTGGMAVSEALRGDPG